MRLSISILNNKYFLKIKLTTNIQACSGHLNKKIRAFVLVLYLRYFLITNSEAQKIVVQRKKLKRTKYKFLGIYNRKFKFVNIKVLQYLWSANIYQEKFLIFSLYFVKIITNDNIHY